MNRIKLSTPNAPECLGCGDRVVDGRKNNIDRWDWCCWSCWSCGLKWDEENEVGGMRWWSEDMGLRMDDIIVPRGCLGIIVELNYE